MDDVERDSEPLLREEAEVAEQRQAPSRISMSDRTALKLAAAVAFAAVVGLIVSMLTAHGPDLTRVALTLAIISFGFQIAFFAMQVWVASEQDRRSGALYRNTGRLLSVVEARTESTVRIIEKQFGFVLAHALRESEDAEPTPSPGQPVEGASGQEAAEGSERPAAPSEEAAPEEPTLQTLVDAVDANTAKLDAIRSTQSTMTADELTRRWRALARDVRDKDLTKLPAEQQRETDRLVRAEYETWPSKVDGEAAVAARRRLPNDLREAFMRIAEGRVRDLDEPVHDLGVAPSDITDDQFEQLQGAGLLQWQKLKKYEGSVERRAILTRLGRWVAALTLAGGEQPEWYREALKQEEDGAQ